MIFPPITPFDIAMATLGGNGWDNRSTLAMTLQQVWKWVGIGNGNRLDEGYPKP